MSCFYFLFVFLSSSSPLSSSSSSIPPRQARKTEKCIGVRYKHSVWVLLPHTPLWAPGDGYGWRWASNVWSTRGVEREQTGRPCCGPQTFRAQCIFHPEHSTSFPSVCPLTPAMLLPMKSEGNEIRCLHFHLVYGRVSLFTDTHTGLADLWTSQNPLVFTSHLAMGTLRFQMYVPMPGFYLRFKLWSSDLYSKCPLLSNSFYSWEIFLLVHLQLYCKYCNTADENRKGHTCHFWLPRRRS